MTRLSIQCRPVLFITTSATTVACGVAAVTTTIAIKSCSEDVDKLQQAAEDGRKYSDNLNKSLDCLSNPSCNPNTAQEYYDQATKNSADALYNIGDATRGLATTIPNTSVTGPAPTSIPEAAVFGTITTIVVETTEE